MKYLNARNTAYGEDRRSYKTGTDGVTSNQTVFNVSYDNGRVEAYLNGVRLYPGDDFTKTSSGIGTSITLASAIGASNVLEIVGYQGINSGNALVEDNFVVGTGSTGSGGSYTNSTTEFPVASSVGDTVSVWRNGIKLVPTTDYTVQAATNKVTLASPGASTDDEITVQVVGGVIHNNGLTVNSGNDSFFLPTTRGADDYVLTRDDSAGTGGTTWKESASAPTITSIKYSNQTSGTFVENTGQTATDPAGGDLCQLIGTNFDTSAGNMSISVAGTSAGSIVVTSSTNATFSAPAKTAGSYTLTATNASGLSATVTISYDANPAWVTPASSPTNSLGNFADGSISGTDGPQIIASEDGSNLTTGYKQVTSNSDNTVITSGVAGLTIGDNGYLTGTLAGTNGGTNTFYAVAHDNENQQSAIRQFHFISYDYAGNGGTIATYTISGTDYVVHRFLTTGISTFSMIESKSCDILIVAGGGSGIGGSGGGGGGGNVLYGTGITIPIGDHSVDVGAGGTINQSGNTSTTNATARGGDSSFTFSSTTYTAIGGGTGGGEGSLTGIAGGNGGGDGVPNAGGGIVSQTNYSNFTEYGGNDGGTAHAWDKGGGGGGAGGDGVDADGSGNGHGGVGQQVGTIYDGATNYYWAGGGGGSERNPGANGGNGGKGGGGRGGNDAGTVGTPGADGIETGSEPSDNSNGGNGGANTGGGGGAGSDGGYGGYGGSGIVLIRYAI